MAKLSLSEWANVAEIGGTIVVIASLAYIGLEVKQNTQALQVGTYQAMATFMLELDIAQASDEELNRIITLAETSPSDASPEEWTRFTKIAYPRYGMWEFLYLQRQNDAVDEITWLAYEPFYLTEFACKRGYRRFWEERQMGFAPPFIEYMQSAVLPTCGDKRN